MHNEHTNVQVSDTTVKILNDTWREIQGNHPDVPDVFLVVKSTGRERRGTVLGHYSYSEWAVDDAQAPEVMISGECFAGGAEQVLQTLLHEAAHGLAHVRGIKDCSRQNRYHNKRFKALAAEVGLEWPTLVDEQLGLFSGFPYPPDQAIGYSAVRLSDETITRYTSRLIWLRTLKVCKGQRKNGTITPGPKRILTGCRCREITFGHVQWGVVAPLVCGRCDGQYRRLPRDGEPCPDTGWYFHLGVSENGTTEHDVNGGFWYTEDGDIVDFCDHYPPTWEESNNGTL